MSILELSHIKKIYMLKDQTVDAVKDVSLKVGKGEFISIVGHSGSGKTTLLSVMGGILSPSSGVMTYKDTDIYALSDDKLSEFRANAIGYIFQFASLMPVLTAKENLLLPAVFKPGVKVDAAHEEKALEYLDLVGLADKADAYPSQLSGGQQRRVAIARALINDPDILLADEPTGDLDEETEEAVMDVLHKANKEKGMSIVMVTHNTELAAVTDRRFRMTGGVMQEL